MFLLKERRAIETTAAFEMELPFSPIAFQRAAAGPQRASEELRPWPPAVGQNAIDSIGTMRFKLCPPEGQSSEAIPVLTVQAILDFLKAFFFSFPVKTTRQSGWHECLMMTRLLSRAD